jgi:Fe-Mn family superoxide dismutase
VELLQNLDQLPDAVRTKVRNNGGGVLNHNLFFAGMTPEKKKPFGKLLEAIERTYGSFENFKATFSKAAMERFGSGWAWLVSDENGDLKIISTPNQDVPLQLTVKPVLEIDVWEHAYYLKYQNRRAEYIENWFNLIDWEKAENIYLNPFK